MYRPLALVLVAFALAMGVQTSLTATASAHTPSPRACTIAWQAAPPGQKFRAKQRCLQAQWRHRCITHPRVVPGSVTVKGLRLRPGKRKGNSPHWRNQRKVIGWLANEALRRHLPRAVLISAVATTTQESSARELDYGDGTSLGPLQLIDIHGTPRERKSIEFSGNWFYNGAIRVWRRYRGHIDAVRMSDAVQRPRVHGRPAHWIPEAERTVRIVLGDCQIA